MKTGKQTSDKNQKTTQGNKQNDASKKKGQVTADTRSSAVDNAKARAGRGLANEGTITSYEAER
jgi:hypothetical protein